MLWLDEADQMLDMGFVNDVKKIVSLLQNRQTLFLCNNANCDSELAEMFFNETVTVSPVSSC
jgi:ATP-dependent RNA helicase RhlE